MSALRSVDCLNHSPEALALFAGAASAGESSSNAFLAVAASSAQKIEPDELDNAFLAVAASSAQKIEPEGLGDALVAFPRGGTGPWG